MRVVLYADDMEPITVIDLTATAERYLNELGVVRLAVMPPQMLSMVSMVSGETMPGPEDLKTVTIFAERFIRRGREHTMLFTRDKESALLMKCAFLPGQHAGMQEPERTAFVRGFLDALLRVGNGRS